ncbi:MAG: hypothetical protein WBV39_12525 [Rudaea sp.]
MTRILYCLAALLLLATGSASAETERSFRAYVVSVDTAGKSIKFRVPDDAKPPKWSVVVATWDDKTVWTEEPEKIWERKPATADLATKLKKDSKVYVSITDNGSHEQRWEIQSLTSMPPDATVP